MLKRIYLHAENNIVDALTKIIGHYFKDRMISKLTSTVVINTTGSSLLFKKKYFKLTEWLYTHTQEQDQSLFSIENYYICGIKKK